MRPITLLPVVFCFIGCSTQQYSTDSNRFYSYVDAQGQLVTIDRQAEADTSGNKRPEVSGSPASIETQSVDESGRRVDAGHNRAADTGLTELSPERYRTSEEIDAELEAKDRDRFYTYIDENGVVREQRYDKVAEQEALRKSLQTHTDIQLQGGYIESFVAVPSDCCETVGYFSKPVELEKQYRVRFTSSIHNSIEMGIDGKRFPAAAYELSNVKQVILKTFAPLNGSYIHPQALFLNENKTPILLVENLFQRWYDSTWYRHGYLEGLVEVPADASYLVLFLGYAPNNDVEEPKKGGVLDLTRVQSSQLGLQGDMTLLFPDGR